MPSFPMQSTLLPAHTQLPYCCKYYSEARSCAQNSFSSNTLTLRQTLVVSPGKEAEELKVRLTRVPCLTSIIQMNHEACAEHAVSGYCHGQAGFR